MQRDSRPSSSVARRLSSNTHNFMRTALLTVWFLTSCQPIMIGNTDGAAGGHAGRGGSSSGGDLGNTSGAAPTPGGSAHGGNASGGTGRAGSAGEPTAERAGESNEGGSPTAGAASQSDGGDGGDGGASSDADEGVIQARVLFVVYDPLMTGVTDPAQSLSTTLGVTSPLELGKQLATTLETLTQGHVHHEVLETNAISESFPPTLDAFRYDPTSYDACRADAKACHLAAADYGAIAGEGDLCTLADDQNADQIWLFGAKRFGFVMGKQLTCKRVADGQVIDRIVDFIDLDYSEGLPSLVASYQAYAAYALQQVFGAPASNAGDEPSYWLSHLPRARWSDALNMLNDHWRYVLHPAERAIPQDVSVTCSSSYLPGWCALAHDQSDVHTCNVNEWATYMEPRGYVEFRFVPPKLVSGVDLYDRACDEQVLAGHIEFSDGSADLGFGALPNLGDTAHSETFEPRLLSGMRVVIDESSPPVIPGTKVNPGFGEITIVTAP